jgi:predicted transcriptional regulator
MVVRKVELTVEQSDRLDALARELDISSDTLAATAIEAMLDLGQWHRDEIEKGLAEADRGEFANEDELKAILDKYTQRA